MAKREKILVLANPADPVAPSVEEGLRGLGFDVLGEAANCWSSTQATTGVRAVVVCGSHGLFHEAAVYYRKRKIPVVSIGKPYLAAEDQVRVAPSREWLPTFDGFPPADRVLALGVELRERKRVKNQAILVLGQRTGGESHGMNRGPFQVWAESVVSRVRSLSESRVVWRPHPDDVWALDGVDGYSDPRKESLAEALAGAWLVITYNSDAAIEALMDGLPVVAEGPAVYSAVCGSLSAFAKIAPPEPQVLAEVLAAIAHTQWTTAEIASGRPFRAALLDEVLVGDKPEPEEEGAETPDAEAAPETAVPPTAPEGEVK